MSNIADTSNMINLYPEMKKRNKIIARRGYGNKMTFQKWKLIASICFYVFNTSREINWRFNRERRRLYKWSFTL